MLASYNITLCYIELLIITISKLTVTAFLPSILKGRNYMADIKPDHYQLTGRYLLFIQPDVTSDEIMTI